MHKSSSLDMEATGTARAKIDMELIAAPALQVVGPYHRENTHGGGSGGCLWHTFATSVAILEPFEFIKHNYLHYYCAFPKQELLHS